MCSISYLDDSLCLDSRPLSRLVIRPGNLIHILMNKSRFYLVVAAHNWRKLDWIIWQETGLPFDHRSILMHSAEPGLMSRKVNTNNILLINK